QVAGDELVAVAVGARVEDEQADVQAVGDLADLLQRVGGDEVQLQRPDLHALRADGLRGLRERAGLAGDEHEVQARVGQPVCEGGADPLRAAGDDGPRAIAVDHCSPSRSEARATPPMWAPPSTNRVFPVRWRASSDARNTATGAMSSSGSGSGHGGGPCREPPGRLGHPARSPSTTLMAPVSVASWMAD